MNFRKVFAARLFIAGALVFSLALPAALAPTPAGAAIYCGGASWYALTGITASGERANPNAMTAAHKSLPFGTRVVVENLNNRKRVTVRINDRGPFVRGRIIDVTRAAAKKLGMIRSGTTKVRVTVAGRAAKHRSGRSRC